MSITNYEGLRVVLRRGALQDTYEFILENAGDAYLWNLRLKIDGILGPDAFGLDDTHMKPPPANQVTAEFECMAPGSSARIARQKWSVTPRYEIGSQRRLIYGTFSPSESREQFYGLRADFIVEENVPIKPRGREPIVRRRRASMYRLRERSITIRIITRFLHWLKDRPQF